MAKNLKESLKDVPKIIKESNNGKLGHSSQKGQIPTVKDQLPPPPPRTKN